MRRPAGFTLLEMLIVIGVTAALVATAVQAHLGIRRIEERVELGASRDRAAEVFLDRIERELSGTFLVMRDSSIRRRSHPYLFVAEDRFESDADADAFRFITRTPARAGPLAESVGLRMVTYEVQTSEDAELELLREEKVLPDFMDKYPAVETGHVALDRVASFRLAFLDGLSGEWRDDWDSTDIALLDRLPVAVELHVALEEETRGGDRYPGPEHSRTVPLPVRPVDLDALRGLEPETGGADDPNGPGEGSPEGETLNDPNAAPATRTCVEAAECADFTGARGDLSALLEGAGTVCDPSEIAALKRMVGQVGGQWTCP